jgi:uncharacterized integral membrane protein
MMIRVALIILATMAFVAFALANTQRVGLSFVVGETDVRLIFLLMTSFTVGAFAAILRQMVESARRRAQRNRIRVVRKRATLNQAQVK